VLQNNAHVSLEGQQRTAVGLSRKGYTQKTEQKEQTELIHRDEFSMA